MANINKDGEICYGMFMIGWLVGFGGFMVYQPLEVI